MINIPQTHFMSGTQLIMYFIPTLIVLYLRPKFKTNSEYYASYRHQKGYQVSP